MGKVDDMADKLPLIGRLRAAANGVGSLKSDQGDYGLLDDAADEIERLGHVAAGRLRWASMMQDKHGVSFQLREWADEMDPNTETREQ